MVDEKRETETMGGRFALTWGDDKLNLKMGGAYDEVSRDIRPLANTQQWQTAVCGGNPSDFVPATERQPPCRGETAAQIVPGPTAIRCRRARHRLLRGRTHRRSPAVR